MRPEPRRFGLGIMAIDHIQPGGQSRHFLCGWNCQPPSCGVNVPRDRGMLNILCPKEASLGRPVVHNWLKQQQCKFLGTTRDFRAFRHGISCKLTDLVIESGG